MEAEAGDRQDPQEVFVLEEGNVGAMSESDHLSHNQALQFNQHNLHSHNLGHGLGHGQHGIHDLHVHAQAEADAQAQADQHVQPHVDGDHVRAHHGHHGHGMHNSEENGVGVEEHDDDPGDEEGLDEAEMHSDGGGNPGDAPQALAVRTQGSTQLTLSYQGEVYVFDTVPPEKVRCLYFSINLPSPKWLSLAVFYLR